jgi:phage tail sheath protein FI
MGVIARNDATAGIFRAPAGIDAVVVNAVGVDTKFTDSDLGTLNAKGVNIIRPVTGRGICVMGARTRKRYAVDKYISARRTLIYLRDTLRAATEFALFENNDERLWDRMETTAERILRPVWNGGGLRGSSPGEAYYIVCDASINTPAVIASGEVRMEVGVALEYPAEFVVIRLTQFEQGGVSVCVNPS